MYFYFSSYVSKKATKPWISCYLPPQPLVVTATDLLAKRLSKANKTFRKSLKSLLTFENPCQPMSEETVDHIITKGNGITQ